jgi:hypothetical protein
MKENMEETQNSPKPVGGASNLYYESTHKKSEQVFQPRMLKGGGIVFRNFKLINFSFLFFIYLFTFFLFL